MHKNTHKIEHIMNYISRNTFPNLLILRYSDSGTSSEGLWCVTLINSKNIKKLKSKAIKMIWDMCIWYTFYVTVNAI